MAKNNVYNVAELLQRANARFVSPVYLPAQDVKEQETKPYEDRTGDWEDTPGDYNYTSKLGVPVWDEITFSLPPTTLADSPKYSLPTECYISIKSEKVIVRTPVNGHRSSVKELYTSEDDVITIKGLFLTYIGDLPDLKKINEFRQFFRINNSLDVVSKQLNELGIYKMCCAYANVEPLQESPNVWTFELTCYEDVDIDLEVADV